MPSATGGTELSEFRGPILPAQPDRLTAVLAHVLVAPLCTHWFYHSPLFAICLFDAVFPLGDSPQKCRNGLASPAGTFFRGSQYTMSDAISQIGIGAPLGNLTPTLATIARIPKQSFVTYRAPSSEANRPTAAGSWTHQQHEQDQNNRDCRACRKFSADPTRLLRYSSFGNPVRHDQDVGGEENDPNQSQHNDFSNCQTHHLSLSKKPMFTNIDGSARRDRAQVFSPRKICQMT